jgi:hypothetical protein
MRRSTGSRPSPSGTFGPTSSGLRPSRSGEVEP